MKAKILQARTAPGGLELVLEIQGAASDRNSREETLFVPVSGDSDISDVVSSASSVLRLLSLLRGEEIPLQLVRKEHIESRLEGEYRRWQRWRNTRLEAQARSAPTVVVTALTNKEDAAWGIYLDRLNQWRQAT